MEVITPKVSLNPGGSALMKLEWKIVVYATRKMHLSAEPVVPFVGPSDSRRLRAKAQTSRLSDSRFRDSASRQGSGQPRPGSSGRPERQGAGGGHHVTECDSDTCSVCYIYNIHIPSMYSRRWRHSEGRVTSVRFEWLSWLQCSS